MANFVNFNLEGMLEHKVQTDVYLVLKVTDGDDQPKDVDKKVEGWLKGQFDEAEVTKSFAQYELKFFPGVVGNYELNINVDGKPLYEGDDVLVKIVDRLGTKTTPLLFTVEGPGLGGGLVNQLTYVVIRTKGTDGKPKPPQDPDDIEVHVGSGSTLQKIKTTKLDDARFQAEFKVDVPGHYDIDVLYEGKSVLKHKEKPHFTSGASPENTKASQVPKEMVAVGKQTGFFLQARNKNDLNNTTGGDLFQVRCDGPAEVPDLVIRDSGDGKYHITFTPTATGIYQFHISLNDVPIGNSPVKIAATRK